MSPAMRRLVLLRHATAEDGVGKPDFDRELTAAGREEARVMGRWLGRRAVQPDAVLSSPAPRALETALLACEVIGIARDHVKTDPALYDCTPTTLLRRVAQAKGRVVLVVGHNPSLEQVALHLTGDEDLAMRGLARAGVVVAELPDDWGDLGAKAAEGWTIADPGTAG
jgi:phosphohistidine phosphatase